MDPTLFDLFAPKPGMDPFALGRLMATSPEALAPELGRIAEPPKDGQSFGDWITEQQGGYGPHVQPQGPAQSALAAAPDGAPGAGGQGTPMFPPMTQTPGQPPTAGGVTGDVSRLLTTAFPGPPSGYFGQNAPPSGTGAGGTPGEISHPGIPGMDFLAGPTPITPDLSRSPVNYGPTFNEAFGSVPGAPTATPPTAAPAGTEALPYTRKTVPDILAPLGEASKTASTETKPPSAQAASKALQQLGSGLAGIKAPPTPAQPSLETPRGVGGQATKAGGNIAQLIAALMGGGGGAGGAGVPLRLGPALYGGGRGLY